MEHKKCGLGIKQKHRAYSIIELLVSLTIGFMIISLSYIFFVIQKDITLTKEANLKVRQSVRSFFHIIEKDIRLINFNPLKRENTGITRASSSLIEFCYDLDEDGKISSSEIFGIGFAKKYDANKDGIADKNVGTLGRKKGAGNFMPIADNIHSIAFAYAYKDSNGKVVKSSSKIVFAYDSDGDGLLDMKIDENQNMKASSLFEKISIKNIVAVKVFILAVIPKKHKKKVQYRYVVGDKLLEGESFLRRKIFTTLIKIR